LETSTVKPWIAFAGGGTGGHLFPALAVAEALGGTRGDIDISFFVTARPIDRQVLEARGYGFTPQVVRPFSRRPTEWWGFWRAWRAACGAARRRFRERRPAMVVGSGGYAAGPPLHVAQKMGIPTALLNPDAVPGRANRFVAKRARLICVQWAVTSDRFPATAPVQVTGCPVRPEFARANREEGVAAFDLDPARKILLVTGASQGARSINLAMLELVGFLAAAGAGPSGAAAWQVLHLAGPDDRQRVADAYAAANLPATVLAFTDRMAWAMAAADLVISRAGASTLAEITALGRPSVLLPYPYHRDQHQRANAQVLADAGAAILLADRVDAVANAGQLRGVLGELMEKPGKLDSMSEAAKRLGRPDAADRVADLIRGACDL